MHRLQHIDHTRHISTSSKSPGCYGGFENRAGFSAAHPVFFLAITCPCCYFSTTFLQPLWDQSLFFRENMKLHISREQIKKGPYFGVIFLKKRCKKGPSKVWWFSLGHFLKENVTFSRAFSVVEWTCFRSKNCVPSTQYPVPSTQYPVPSTQYPVPSTQYPVPKGGWRVPRRR